MRESGRICAVCSRSLPPPYTPGEKRCVDCGGNRRIYRTFFLRRAWSCSFLEEDLKTPLPKKLTFRTPDKILQLAERCHAFSTLETRQAVDHAIALGRGGIWLELTAEQYQKLRGA